MSTRSYEQQMKIDGSHEDKLDCGLSTRIANDTYAKNAHLTLAAAEDFRTEGTGTKVHTIHTRVRQTTPMSAFCIVLKHLESEGHMGEVRGRQCAETTLLSQETAYKKAPCIWFCIPFLQRLDRLLHCTNSISSPSGSLCDPSSCNHHQSASSHRQSASSHPAPRSQAEQSIHHSKPPSPAHRSCS
jgi:hypothetical protein